MPSAWPTIRSHLTSIVENTPRSHNATHVTGPFKVLEGGLADDGSNQPRSCDIKMSAGAAQLPGCFLQKGRMRAQVRLRVIYPGETVRRLDELDAIVGSDVEALIAEMLDEDNLPPAAPGGAGIELIGQRDGGHETIPFDIVDLDDGGCLVVFDITVIYRRGPK